MLSWFDNCGHAKSYFSLSSKYVCWTWQHGSVYKLAFGPKAFVVVSDPIVARHVLRENAFCYDKVLHNCMLLDSTHPSLVNMVIDVNMSLCKMPFIYVSMYELSLFGLYSYRLNYSSHIYTCSRDLISFLLTK